MSMSGEEKFGTLMAYQEILEEIATIKAELARKGIEEKGLTVLEGFIDDAIKEVLGL